MTTTYNTSQVSVMERKLMCSDGLSLAGQEYTCRSSTSQSESTKNVKRIETNVLCLHGWMDNAASFHILAPALASSLAQYPPETNNEEERELLVDVHVMALDLPGHGQSSHKSKDGPVMVLSEYLVYIAEAITQLGWFPTDDKSNNANTTQKQLCILGHSMGAMLSLLFSATYPEHVSCLVCLEGMLPMPMKMDGRDFCSTLRKAVDGRLASNTKLYPKDENASSDGGTKPNETRGAGNGRAKVRTMAQAIQARIKTASMYPGQQYISKEAAKVLVHRGTLKHGTNSMDNDKVDATNQEERSLVSFAHDVRLNLPSLQYMTQEQVEGVLHALGDCPVCVLRGQDGWPVEEERYSWAIDVLLMQNDTGTSTATANRRGKQEQGGLPESKQLPVEENTVLKVLPGSHHFHADPDTADEVIEHVVSFVRRSLGR